VAYLDSAQWGLESIHLCEHLEVDGIFASYLLRGLLKGVQALLKPAATVAIAAKYVAASI